MYIEGAKKMNWNHRVVRFKAPDEIFTDYLEICEVYYEDDVVVAHTEKGVSVGGNNIEEIRQTLLRMLDCLDKPVLEEMQYEEDR